MTYGVFKRRGWTFQTPFGWTHFRLRKKEKGSRA